MATPRYAQNPLSRFLPWLGALVLAGGVAALVIVLARGGGDSRPAAQPAAQAPAQVADESGTSSQAQRSVPFSAEARAVAAEFLRTAVPRKNLQRSWEITHPELRNGYTLKSWLTGTIPVQFYPTDDIDLATFKIDESYANEAVIEVALLPKKGVAVKPQIFFVGLKKHRGEWKVNYFAPRGVYGANVAGDANY